MGELIMRIVFSGIFALIPWLGFGMLMYFLSLFRDKGEVSKSITGYNIRGWLLIITMIGVLGLSIYMFITGMSVEVS